MWKLCATGELCDFMSLGDGHYERDGEMEEPLGVSE